MNAVLSKQPVQAPIPTTGLHFFGCTSTGLHSLGWDFPLLVAPLLASQSKQLVQAPSPGTFVQLLDCTLWVGTSLFWLHLYWPPSPSNLSRHPFQLLDFTFLVAPLLDCTLWVGTSLFWLHLYWTALYDSVVIKAWLTTVEIHSFARCFRSTIKIWKIATILYHTELEYIRLLRRELFR